MAFGIDDAIAAGLKIVDKLIPDPTEKAKAALAVMQMKQAGDFKEIDAQLQTQQMQADINREEAANTSVFVAGWRPFVGWVCGTGFGMAFVIGPLLEWFSKLLGHGVVFPVLDAGTLTTLLFGMLGLGAMRTVEKVKGVGQPVN